MRVYKRRTDKNQQEIMDYFRQKRCSVIDLSKVANGCPDLLVGINGVNLLVEIKSEKGKLTEDQSIFFNNWKGQAVVVKTLEDADRLIAEHQSPSKN